VFRTDHGARMHRAAMTTALSDKGTFRHANT